MIEENSVTLSEYFLFAFLCKLSQMSLLFSGLYIYNILKIRKININKTEC